MFQRERPKSIPGLRNTHDVLPPRNFASDELPRPPGGSTMIQDSSRSDPRGPQEVPKDAQERPKRRLFWRRGANGGPTTPYRTNPEP
eukprot:3582108-Pyramimonas_sp.AAC.1